MKSMRTSEFVEKRDKLDLEQRATALFPVLLALAKRGDAAAQDELTYNYAYGTS